MGGSRWGAGVGCPKQPSRAQPIVEGTQCEQEKSEHVPLPTGTDGNQADMSQAREPRQGMGSSAGMELIQRNPTHEITAGECDITRVKKQKWTPEAGF